MSQINPNGQSNNGNNYHPGKRNINHRGQQASSYNPYAQAAFAPEYIGAYQQVYQPYYAQQYYTQPTYVQPVFSPRQGQDFNGQHQLNITTSNGEKVDLRNINSTGYTPKSSNASLNRSNVSTPKAAPPSTHQRTPSVTSTPASSGNSELDAMRESFRKQVLARAQKAKKAEEPKKEEPKKEETETKPKEKTPPAPVSSEPTPKPAEVKPVVPAKDETEEDPVKKFKELVAAKTQKTETESSPAPEASKAEVKEATISPVAEESTPVTKAEEPKSEEQTQVENENEVEDASKEQPSTSAVSQEPSEGPKKEDSSDAPVQETIVEESKSENQEEHKSAALDYTISKFFQQLEKANVIDDPFTFKYSGNNHGPDEKLKSSASTKKFRYDPVFLLQFAPIVNYPTDEEFKEKIKFIQVGDRRNDRSLSKGGPGGQFRSGFGQGSISGIQGSQFSKSGSSRKPFDLNSRSNSRQNSKRRGGPGRNERKSNRNRDRDAEKEPEVPAEPVKPLEKSANRWIPKSRLAKTEEIKYAPDGVTVIISQEEVVRKVKSLLNKLTLEFFEEISNDLLNIAKQSLWEETAETLKSVLELTFAKACDEPHWSSMYAQFTAKMCKDIEPEISDKELVDKKTGEPVKGGALVRKLLLTRCQIEYSKGWADKLPTNEDGSAIEPEMMSEEYYEAAAAKRRGLGLIRFIGHLYVLGLLSDAIIFICLDDQSKNTTDPSEDTVENLIQLIKTVGQKLDTHPNSQFKNRFNVMFQRIEVLIEKGKISSRLQFKLMDLVDLRKKRWAGGESEKGPKTITEIHEEAEKKQKEDDSRQKERRNQNRNDSRSNSSKSGWGTGRVSSSDIKNVGVVRNSNSSSNLGPMNNFSRSRSLRGSSRQPSQSSTFENTTPAASPSPLSARENSKKSEPAGNRFALLNDDEQHDDKSDDEATQEEQVVPESDEQQPVEEEEEEEEETQEVDAE